MKVNYERINRSVEKKAARNRKQEHAIYFWSSEKDFMVNLQTLIKEADADPDLIELQWCLEENNSQQILNDSKQVAKKLINRRG